MVHYFEPPLDERDPRRPRRKRANPENDPDEAEQLDNPVAENQNIEEEEEEEDNGLQNLPAYFPHAPLPDDALGKNHYPAGIKQRNLARQHLNALNTILHKSLLEQDFARANRAFGLLIRTQLAGQRLDLRKKGLWGIGAEILLRQSRDGHAEEDHGAPDVEAEASAEDEAQFDTTWPSDEGFSAARAYYERLILQYPYRRTRPSAVSAQHFYPAMCGLWIFQVQTASDRALASVGHASESNSNSDATSPSSVNSMQLGDENRESRSATELASIRTQAIKSKELEQARKIAARLNEVTFLPPFDRDAELLKLRGMVALWMADLVLATRPEAEKEVEGFRDEGRALLKRARDYGWKPTEDLVSVVEGNGEGMDVDDDY